MGTYERRIQAPEKSLNADWVPEEGELFKNGANLYMGDNTTASNALTPINVGGVKRYVALLTQTGTDAPIATVAENTLGGEVVWTRSSTGVYLGTLAGAFLGTSKIVCRTDIFNPAFGYDEGTTDVIYQLSRINDDAVRLYCTNASGPVEAEVAYLPVEINIYQ